MASNELDKLNTKIAAVIRAHPDKYENAYKWLNDYCSEEQWRNRREAERGKKREGLRSLRQELKAFQKDLETSKKNLSEKENLRNASNTDPDLKNKIDELRGQVGNKETNISRLQGEIDIVKEHISELTQKIQRTEKIPLMMRFHDAWNYWLNRYEGYKRVTAEDGRCILLISLLLLEPDCKMVTGTLTIFSKWPWMTDDEIDSRAWAGIPLQLGEYADRWWELTKSALKQVKRIDKIETAQNKEKETYLQEKDGQSKKITKDEANVRARQLLRETPNWDWTCRKLAKLIPCSLGWIPKLSAWRAYHEKRLELRRNKTIDTVSISKELEAVLGEGEKDEVLRQLIADQEADEREDARQARLYLSHNKKPERDR
jgi:hypothetical protein